MSAEAVFPLWIALSNARMKVFDLHVPPWESTVPSVQQAWDELTHPNNLLALKAWLGDPDHLNPTALEATLQAISVCEERLKQSLK